MRPHAHPGSSLTRAMAGGSPGGVADAQTTQARDRRIAEAIAAGHARQAAEQDRADRAAFERAEAEKEAALTPIERERRRDAEFMDTVRKRAAARRASEAYAPAPPAPTGSVPRGRALWADQQRRRA